MGMFDYVTCKYPLPVPGANELQFQSKDTPSQFMEYFEIREDGTIWREDYDTEDWSQLAKWKSEHPGEIPPPDVDSIVGMYGCMTRVNKRWVQVPFRGEVRFGTWLKDKGSLEFSTYFVDGTLSQLQVIECDDKYMELTK